jgi:hypothetical protein
MISFLQTIKYRNPYLFYFGILCLFLAMIFLILANLTTTQIYGFNAWYKPFKFAFSTLIFSWSMAWYCYYLPNFNLALFNWSTMILLGFEIIYITIQASRGQLSHYNVDTPFYAVMFFFMALAATLVTIHTAYIALLFFKNSFTTLPNHYLWAIRLALIIFVIFSFEGFLMGSRLSHSVGAFNDNSDWWIIGWSKIVGDLRVAHFIGMHALQVLPIISFYILKDTKLTIAISTLYGLLAVITLIQALAGNPLISTFINHH